jgi:uncharacterized protein involved in outer membrane biogenesis
MRSRRVLVTLLVAGVGLLLAGWFGLKLYLNSAAGRSLAASKLSTAIGLPVEVDAMSLGANSSSLSFRVMDPGNSAAELLRVDSATADVSLSDLVSGSASPSEITVNGAALTLAVGADGQLLTPFPAAGGGTPPAKIPAVRITGGALTIRQAGRPDFRLANIDLRSTPDGDTVTLAGTAADPDWGTWELTGEANIAAKAGRIVLTAAAATLTPERLKSIPFVPAEVWAQVSASGETAAKITFEYAPDAGFRYDVELTPKAATIGVPAIDATFRDVAGTIRVRAAKVTLEHCTGTLAGGPVAVSSEMDFAPEPAVLKFDVSASGVDVRQLPAEWGLPPQVAGKLRGKAGLELRVHADGRVEPRGGGAAAIDGATIAGLPAEVTLRLRADGKRYRFQSDMPAPNARRGAPPVPTRRQVKHVLQPAADEKPATFEANIALRDVDLGELLNRLELNIPYTFAGKVTIQASVAVPVASAASTKNYRVRGTITSSAFTFQGLTVRDLTATIESDRGVLKLTALKGTLPNGDTPGSFLGTASAAVEPRGDVTATLDLTRIPLDKLRKAMPSEVPDVRGSVSGTATFSAPFEKLSDPATWRARGTLTSDDLVLFGRTVRDAAIGVTVAKGTATLSDTKFTVEGIPATVAGTLGLTAPYPFAATVRTAGTRVGEITKLIPGFTPPFAIGGKFETDSRVKGNLSPPTFSASGKAAAADLRLGTSEENAASFAWELSDTHVKVTDLKADLFRGTITGSADVPFAADKAGTFAVKFAGVDAGLATRQVKEFPVRLTGRISGGVTGTLPAADKGKPRTMTADVDLTAPKLTVQGIPAERLTGAVRYDRGAVEYSLEGRSLGGTFDVKGRYPQRANPKPDPSDKGSFRGRNLDLGRLGSALGLAGLGALRGTVDVALNFDGDLADGDGQVSVRGLSWGTTRLAPELTVRLRMQDGIAFANDIAGQLAGGQLRGRVRYDLRRPGRNFFTLSLDRADPERLFAPAPDLAAVVSGPVSLVVRGRLSPSAFGSGTVELARGTLADLPATNLRLPFDWAVGTGTGRVALRDIAGTVGGGRVTGKAEYNWGYAGRLSGQIRFSEVRMRRLLSNVGGASAFGSGRVSGRIDLGGDSVRGVNDVTARLVATLNSASVQEVPILRLVTPYLSPAGVLGPFTSGDVRARLAGGIIRVERFALATDSAKLYADGTVTLAGRLDLAVVAQTGQLGIDNRGLLALGLRLPAFGPLPLTVIRDVTEFLSNRTIRLTVTGTTRSPSIQVNAAALLTEEAIRFLVKKYTPFSPADLPTR